MDYFLTLRPLNRVKVRGRNTRFTFKVRCAWQYISMYLRPYYMLKPYFKFQNSILKGLKVIFPFTCHYSPVPGECFISLVQAVTSQAENCMHIKEVLID